MALYTGLVFPLKKVTASTVVMATVAWVKDPFIYKDTVNGKEKVVGGAEKNIST